MIEIMKSDVGYSFEPAELVNDVRRLYGEQQSHDVKEAIFSTAERNLFARFHFHESRKILNGGQTEVDIDEAAMLLSSEGDEKRLIAKAHVIACIANIHATQDHLAYSICKALNLQSVDPSKRTERLVNFHNVYEWLVSGATKKLLGKLKKSQDLRYISFLNNRAKHRSLFDVKRTVSFEQSKHGLKTVEVDGYRSRWIDELLSAAVRIQVETLRELWPVLATEVRACVVGEAR